MPCVIYSTFRFSFHVASQLKINVEKYLIASLDTFMEPQSLLTFRKEWKSDSYSFNGSYVCYTYFLSNGTNFWLQPN